MTIDPRLYEKVTGRRPGEALERAAASMAGRGSRDPDDTSTWSAIGRGRMYVRVGAAIVALAIVLYFVLTWR